VADAPLPDHDPSTVVVTAGRGRGAAGDPVNVPVELSSTYRAGGDVIYGRESNPVWVAFESAVCALEGGAAGVSFASGMAAVAAVASLVPAGGVVVAPEVAYKGARTLFQAMVADGRLGEVRLVDITDTAAVLGACDGADLLWAESPTNPSLGVADLAALAGAAPLVAVDNTFATPLLQRPLALGADVSVHSATKFLSGHSDVVLGVAVASSPSIADRLRAHRRGAPPPTTPWWGVAPRPARAGAPPLVAVDNTFATPLLQRPLALGADVSVHSATKFLSGHSDVVLGVAVASSPSVADRLRAHRTMHGSIPGPMEAFLALRGLRTLAVRVERSSATAAELARRLAAHPAVDSVRYPGFGAMLAPVVRGGAAGADAVCAAVRLAVPATSLGGVETLIERRGKYAGEEATPPGLLRISVGLEHVDDLWADLAHALAAVPAGA
jgi:cystathionine gamma-synthase